MTKPSKLQLAVNHAVQDYNNRYRAWAAANRDFGTGGLDGKRPRAWCEYGFKEHLEFADFYNAYRRRGIAFGAVDKLVNACWSTFPWLIEGDPDEESDTESAWEKQASKMFRPLFWSAFETADRYRLAARYSALILHFADNLNWDQPVRRNSKLIKMTPVWQSALKPTKFNEERSSIDFGEPTEWHYTESAKEGSTQALTVHADRVFILGDWRAGALGFLEPVFNNLVSMEKVEGGSGESFLKNAARQLSVSFDKEIDLSSLAQMYGVSLNELHEKFNEATRELNRGNDVMLINQGATVNPLVSDVPDPTPTFNVNLQVVACGLDIPSKILVGMQTGERASSEDQKYFDKRCQARRVKQLSFEVENLMRRLMRLGTLTPKDEISVMWTDLTEQTGADKLANAKVMSEINSANQASGVEIFDGNEIRVAAGFEPTTLKPLPDDEPVDDNITGGDEE